MINTTAIESQPKCIVDLPKGGLIKNPIEHIWGWVDVKGQNIESTEIAATIGGRVVPCAKINRGRPNRIGFSIYIDLSRLPETLETRPDVLLIELKVGPHILDLPLNVAPVAYKLAFDIGKNRELKAAFIKNNSTELIWDFGTTAPVFLPNDWTLSPHLKDKSDGVSSHYYSQDMLDFLKSFSPDQYILDAGAGLRKRPYPNVINMEIYDYPSTDIISIGQELPFKDNTFDGVISMAVLEHVDDPFTCASEIIRVLKPGGRIYVVVPFLQPEHGYPSHYFNCTRFGLRKLFEGADLVEHKVPDGANHPIMTLHKLATIYACGLPSNLHESFLDLKIRDLVNTSPDTLFANKAPYVVELDETARWRLACATTAIFTKT